jgi:hypothetical protein
LNPGSTLTTHRNPHPPEHKKTARISGNYCAQKILKLRVEKVKSNLLLTLNARSNFHQQARFSAKTWKQANTFHLL